MSENNYWLRKEMPGGVKIMMFDIVHPKEPSNGTDGSPQVRINTFLDGQMKVYDKWNSLEGARKLWSEMIEEGFVRIEAEWTEEKGTMELWPYSIEI